jgi:hypothetical protein
VAEEHPGCMVYGVDYKMLVDQPAGRKSYPASVIMPGSYHLFGPD